MASLDLGLDPGSTSGRNVTQLLDDWRNADEQAREQLMSVVYNDLRRLAAHYMRRERRFFPIHLGMTLETVPDTFDGVTATLQTRRSRFKFPAT